MMVVVVGAAQIIGPKSPRFPLFIIFILIKQLSDPSCPVDGSTAILEKPPISIEMFYNRINMISQNIV